MMSISHLRHFRNAALLLLVFSAGMGAIQAQARPEQGPAKAASTHKSPAAPAQVEAHAEVPARPASLLEQPAKPATVKLDAGKLWVEADNASLSQILQSLTTDTGMKVDGLSGDQRIFGNYGPGDPHEVLQSLLEGSGYNVMMVGINTNGAPRQLLLTHRPARGADQGRTPQAQPENPPEEEDDPNAGEPEEGPNNPPFIQRPGVERPPDPNENPGGAPPGVPHPGDQTDPNVRTPQQMLEQLQQIRQQQMMQQQEPPQQQPDAQPQPDPQQEAPQATSDDQPQE